MWACEATKWVQEEKTELLQQMLFQLFSCFPLCALGACAISGSCKSQHQMLGIEEWQRIVCMNGQFFGTKKDNFPCKHCSSEAKWHCSMHSSFKILFLENIGLPATAHFLHGESCKQSIATLFHPDWTTKCNRFCMFFCLSKIALLLPLSCLPLSLHKLSLALPTQTMCTMCQATENC